MHESNEKQEQSVIVYICYSDGRSISSSEEEISSLEKYLEESLESSGIGEFDGDDFSENQCVLYMYGDSADKIFDLILPSLIKLGEKYRIAVVKRYGEPGAEQERFVI
jgi:hypothetical protein